MVVPVWLRRTLVSGSGEALLRRTPMRRFHNRFDISGGGGRHRDNDPPTVPVFPVGVAS